MRTKKAKIVYINKQYRSYDVIKYNLLAQEYNLFVIWLCDFRSDDLPGNDLINKINYRILSFKGTRLQPWHIIVSIKLFYQLLKNLSSDLFISSTSDSWHSKIVFFFTRIFKKRIALRKEVWYENPSKNLMRKFNKKLTLKIEKKSNAILIPGIRQKQFLEINHTKIKTYYFPYLIDSSKWIKKEEKIINPKNVQFIYWGRLIPLKGVDILIKVANKLAVDYDNFIVKIIGGGTDKIYQSDESLNYDQNCFKLAKNSSYIEFLGQIDNDKIINYIDLNSVFVMPNVKYVNNKLVGDGWGNALVEALCANIPLIASDRVASAQHCISENENGFIINSENLEKELYDAMLFFIKKPNKIDSFSSISKEKVTSVNNPHTMVMSINKILNEK